MKTVKITVDVKRITEDNKEDITPTKLPLNAIWADDKRAIEFITAQCDSCKRFAPAIFVNMQVILPNRNQGSMMPWMMVYKTALYVEKEEHFGQIMDKLLSDAMSEELANNNVAIDSVYSLGEIHGHYKWEIVFAQEFRI